ncbi:MAG: sugar transferase [Clostridia bacterium]|nr:sugar transferase [Clostridia bacterium]
MYKHFIKRTLDILLSLCAIIILWLPMLIVAIIIKCEDPGPAIFKQNRVGANKKIFSLYKFRSMRLDTPHDTPTHLLENPGQYILKVGGFIRKTSIDELPQLWNILKGERGIIETTKNNADFSRVVTVNSISLWRFCARLEKAANSL